MRIAHLAAVAALTLTTAIPVFAGSHSKLPQQNFPKVQPCTAPCDWAFNKCVKKVQDSLNRGESPGYTTKQEQEFTKCTSAKFACLMKRNCPVGDVDCTKDKTC